MKTKKETKMPTICKSCVGCWFKKNNVKPDNIEENYCPERKAKE